MRLALDPSDPLSPALLSAFGFQIDAFLSSQAALVAEVGAGPLLELAHTFTGSGKRVRPAFAYWGHVAAAGPDTPQGLIQAAASLDLLHVSALVHDDIIDASETRRGLPAAHRQLAGVAAADGPAGERFGQAAAILLGDLLVMWSVEMFERAALAPEAIARAQPHLWAMRSEVTCGQYLDLAAAYSAAGADTDQQERDVSRRVLEYKSASYSVRRPAQLGAALGGADPALIEALGSFGSGIGRAFQLRDDILGVFGDPEITGKPAGDDLREGKRTFLVLTAMAQGTASQREALAAMLGNPELAEPDVDRARAIITETGCLATIENMIDQESAVALATLDASSATAQGRRALTRLAELSTNRQR
ncbi:MAG: polyprenyl synthetase family protein [Arachnia sp.]